MRFFAVLALAAVASAVSINRRQTFPSCADNCLATADFGSCDPSDDGCLCKSSSFVSSVTNCINSACSGSDITTADSAAQQLCLAVGVTLTSAPTSTATSTGAAAGSTTSASATPSTTVTSNGAASHGVNALAALAVVGAAALAL